MQQQRNAIFGRHWGAKNVLIIELAQKIAWFENNPNVLLLQTKTSTVKRTIQNCLQTILRFREFPEGVWLVGKFLSLQIIEKIWQLYVSSNRRNTIIYEGKWHVNTVDAECDDLICYYLANDTRVNKSPITLIIRLNVKSRFI